MNDESSKEKVHVSKYTPIKRVAMPQLETFLQCGTFLQTRTYSLFGHSLFYGIS